MIYHNLCAVKDRLVNTRIYMDILTVLNNQFDGRVTFGCKQAVSIVFFFIMVHNEILGHSFGKVI